MVALGSIVLRAEAMDDAVKFVVLPHVNRRIAYRELGCLDRTTSRSLLAFHGLMSCRLCAMPAQETLNAFGVRLVVIDRPGYGQSDPDYSQTFESTIKDVEAVIDALDLGKKVWLLGFSMGGAFCWAAARYMPERIAGIALWSPVGNYKWKGVSREDRAAANYSLARRALLWIAGLIPFVAFRWYGKWASKTSIFTGPAREHPPIGLSAEDWPLIQRPGVWDELKRDWEEAGRYFEGFGAAKDLQLMFRRNWGFEIGEVGKALQEANVKVHIWQGDRDKLVPLGMQQWVKKQLPETVHLHKLPGESHISWMLFNDSSHRLTLSTLFQEQEDLQNISV